MDSGRDVDAARLDELTAETRNVINNLKERIKALDREPMAADAQMRKNRVSYTYIALRFNSSEPNIIDGSCPFEIPRSHTELSKG